MARMISRQESAELLGCSLQTVTNWVERGLLKGHVIGHALMVDRDSIQQYFDDLKELGAMAEQISDMKSEYKLFSKTLKRFLGKLEACILSLHGQEMCLGQTNWCS